MKRDHTADMIDRLDKMADQRDRRKRAKAKAKQDSAQEREIRVYRREQ